MNKTQNPQFPPFTEYITVCVYLCRSGENDVDFIGNLETEEGELPDDLAGATGRIQTPILSYFFIEKSCGSRIIFFCGSPYSSRFTACA